MGETVDFEPGQRLVVEPPSVYDPSAALPEPEIRMRLYRLLGRERRIVADRRGAIDLAVPGPGVYRVEVGIVPRHLTPYLGEAAGRYLREVPWIYSNPIRVVEPPTRLGQGSGEEERRPAREPAPAREGP
jgi:hypothetical protein